MIRDKEECLERKLMMEQKQESHATVSINNVQYEVIKNFRDGFSEEAFNERDA